MAGRLRERAADGARQATTTSGLAGAGTGGGDDRAAASPWICFAPDTDPSVVEALTGSPHGHRTPGAPGATAPDAGTFTAAAFQYLSRPRWTDTAINDTSFFNRLGRGDATVLTWSIVDDGLSIPGDSGEPTSPSNLRAWLDGLYPGGEAEWLPLFQQVFDRWAEVTGVKYVYEPNDSGTFALRSGSPGVRGDIRIAGHFIDGDGDVLAYNFGPNNGDMVIDTGDIYFNNRSSNSRALRNVIAHEHGHGLGLAHVCPIDRTKLMEPNVTSRFDGPQLDDIYSAQRQYGDRLEDPDLDSEPEDNDAPARAADLGTLGLGTHRFGPLSIDDDSDQDYLRLAPAAPGYQMAVVLRPVGASYLEGPQGSSSCSAGTPFDSRAVHDLSLAVLDASGANTLAGSNSSGAGGEESVGNVTLAATGALIFIDGDSTDSCQLYELEITLSSPPAPPELRVADSEAGEGDGSLLFQVELSRSPVVAASVDYAISGDTAEAGSDFASGSGTLVFPPSTLVRTVVVTLIDDRVAEPLESLTLVLSNPVNASLPDATASGRISDDDPLDFTAGAAQLLRGGDPPTRLTFPTIPGRSYSVEYSSDLVTWRPLSGDAVLADGASATVDDPVATGARRFYRIRESL